MEHTFKRKDQVVPLNAGKVGKAGAINEDLTIQIDPQLMFQRLVIAGEDQFTDNSQLFQHELASVPPSVFDNNGLPREATKASLADALWNDSHCMADVSEEKQQYRYVLDGGSLIQRIPWVVGTSFINICQVYIDYVKHNFADATVVFDGYPEGPSTKDVTHMRRNKGQRSTDIIFTESMPCKVKKELFLSNKRNKQRFINLLSAKMMEQQINVHHADDDADLLVVQTALDFARKNSTIVIGEDTDILVLLCHHIKTCHKQVIYGSAKRSQGKVCRIWDINRISKFHGDATCHLLPFIHAMTGCDTTSRMFGIGKALALKKVLTCEYLKQQGDVFMSERSTKDEVTKAGEEAISCLYGGMPLEGLKILRWRKFTSKIVQNRGNPVAVQSLPPTPDAANFHSLRIYLQCQIWGGAAVSLDPSDWGWFEENGKYLPEKMTLPPAPDHLLKIIRCNCKANCDTKRCTCRKSGLDCSVACGECRGACSNFSQSAIEDDDTNVLTDLDDEESQMLL